MVIIFALGQRGARWTAHVLDLPRTRHTAFWDLCADWHGRLARTYRTQLRTRLAHFGILELWSQQEFVRSVPTGTGTITCTVLLNCIESSIGSVLDLILFLFNLTLLLTTTTTTREHQPTMKKPRDAQWHRALPVAISQPLLIQTNTHRCAGGVAAPCYM